MAPSDSKPRHSSSDEAQYDLENSIGYLLNRAAHLIAARFSDDLKPHAINLQAWRILAALSAMDNLSMSELADHTGAELSYLSRAFAALEERGLVERTPSPSDKRTICLSLTKAGSLLVRKLAPKGRELERASVATVSAADLKITLRTLRTVYHNMVTLADAAAEVNRKLTIARRVSKRSRVRLAETAVRGKNV